ncbi:MAG: hypothetical protein AB4040_11755 [Synechococcus sp.]
MVAGKTAIFPLRVQIKSIRFSICLNLLISAILIGIVLLLHAETGTSFGGLTRDVTAIGRVPAYSGFLSQIGIFIWAAAAGVCMFSAKLISRFPDSLRLKPFFFVSGLLTLLLGLDDLFQLHEWFFPHIGIPQKIVLITYVGLILGYVTKFFSTILKTDYILLGMSLVFFCGSLVLDVLLVPSDMSLLFEDGAKLIGIVSWLSYFSRVGVSAVYREFAKQQS